MYFLIQYDRAKGELVQLRMFGSDERSLVNRERLALEISLLGAGTFHEVVLLEAESEEALKLTHNRYFQGLERLARSPGG